MTTYITIAVKSGGEGKTRTAVDLSHRLAQDGSKTMLVSFDSQGNDSTYLGFDPNPPSLTSCSPTFPSPTALRHLPPQPLAHAWQSQEPHHRPQ